MAANELEMDALALFPTAQHDLDQMEHLRSIPNLIHFMNFVSLKIRHIFISNTIPKNDTEFRRKLPHMAINFGKRAEELCLTENYQQHPWKLKILERLTIAISYAVPQSECLVQLYASRGVYLLALSYGKEALEDVKRATAMTKDKCLKYKLRNLQTRILKTRPALYRYHFKTPHVLSKKIGLARRQNDRTFIIVANKDLLPGEVIFTEQAFVQTITMANRLTHCHYCLELCYNLLPCNLCSEDLYCSGQCLDRAYEEYHRFECPLYMMGLIKENLLYLKLGLKLLARCRRNMEPADKHGFFRADLLWQYVQSQSLQDLFQDCQETLILYYHLLRVTDILQHTPGENDPDKKQLLQELLLYQKIAVKMFQTPIYKTNGLREKIKVADAIYDTYSKIREGDNGANAFAVFYGNVLVLRASDKIRMGEEILVESRTYSTADSTDEEK